MASSVRVTTEGKPNGKLRDAVKKRLLDEIEGAEAVEFHPREVVVKLKPGAGKGASQRKLSNLMREHFSMMLPSSPSSDF